MKVRYAMAIATTITLISAIALNVKANEGATGYTYISEDLQEACYEVGNDYGISPYLLMAIIETESSGNVNAKNGSCLGVCQIDSNVWKCEDYYDPYENSDMCCRILTEYRDESCGDVAHVLSMYNGVSNADELCEQGKMSDYAEKVLAREMEISENVPVD